MPANPARGEVEVTVGTETFVLAPEFGRIARFQGASGIVGLPGLMAALDARDAMATFLGLQCLAVSGKLESLEAAAITSVDVERVAKALQQAIRGPDAGNAEGGVES